MPRFVTYTVDVDVTDRTRRDDGSYVAVTRRVEVAAIDDTEATLVACQLVLAIRSDIDPMVLGARIVDLVL